MQLKYIYLVVAVIAESVIIPLFYIKFLFPHLESIPVAKSLISAEKVLKND